MAGRMGMGDLPQAGFHQNEKATIGFFSFGKDCLRGSISDQKSLRNGFRLLT
jgi:hypothetical protein